MRLSFVDFLNEGKENHAVLAFGRMNPPTTGHEVLVNKVKEIAAKHNATHHIVLSHTQDKSKNPLSAEQKLKHAKRFFPNTNLSVATKEDPNFLAQAAKLHKQGVTHLHMVGGSDRVPEFHKLLHKYNGTHEGALFNFKKIEVHSAGERDPDAEGTTGMSASKMRSHAISGNFDDFKKGIPSHVKEHHAKELYNDVRKGMNLKEQFNLREMNSTLIQEGVNDKGIFKVVFLAGGPGSGKDYIMKKTLEGNGLIEINSDKAFEFLMDKYNLDKKMPDKESQQRDELRKKAKNVTELKQRLAIQGRNGLIINGTGDDSEKITKMIEILSELGYDKPKMVMVNTRNDVSRQRNVERGQLGGRTVPEKIRQEKWDAVQQSIVEYKKIFGSDYFEIDNSEDLRIADPEVVQDKMSEFDGIYSKMRKYVEQPVQNDKALQWVASQQAKKTDSSSSSNLRLISSNPNPSPKVGNDIMNQARQLGLSYYGFGRFGKNGKVTYKEVDGRLQRKTSSMNESVSFKNFKQHKNPSEIAAKHSIPLLFLMKQLKMGIKVEKEHTNSYKMARIIALQHLEEYPDYYSRLKKAESKPSLKESYSLSDSDALTLLNLNFPIGEQSKNEKKKMKRKDLISLFSKMLDLLSDETIDINESKAEKEKELINEDDSRLAKRKTFQEYSGTERNIRTTRSSAERSKEDQNNKNSCQEGCECQEADHKSKKSKEKVESYDSPSADGVTFGNAGSPEKISRFKGGIASVTELTGDSEAVSIPDAILDSLKKNGINPSSFKSKNVVG